MDMRMHHMLQAMLCWLTFWRSRSTACESWRRCYVIMTSSHGDKPMHAPFQMSCRHLQNLDEAERMSQAHSSQDLRNVPPHSSMAILPQFQCRTSSVNVDAATCLALSFLCHVLLQAEEVVKFCRCFHVLRQLQELSRGWRSLCFCLPRLAG